MVCLFSRSGSVMVEVLNRIQFQTESLGMELTIMTNNWQVTDDWMDKKSTSQIILPNWSKSVFQYRSFIKCLTPNEIESELLKMEPTKVFLFGYMRILSKEVCERHEIYNLHPGDIIKDPTLKGKDPIEKYFSRIVPGYFNRHELGCVIHKVTAEVDEGEILLSKNYQPEDYSHALVQSRELAIEMWVEFINTLK